MHLDAGSEYETNEQQLIEAETALEAFDRQIVKPESDELQKRGLKAESRKPKAKKR